MNLKHVIIGGNHYPIHFGMAAIMDISEAIGVESDNIFEAFNIRSAAQRLQLAYIGMKHGARIAGTECPQELPAFCDLLDQNPDALDEIIGCYFLQTYGKKMEALIAEAEKIANEEVDAALDNLKNVWPVLIGKASKLASAEYRK